MKGFPKGAFSNLLIKKAMQETQTTWMQRERQNKNNLGYWYPKVENCGFLTPKTIIIDTPDDIMRALFLEEKGDRKKIREFVRNVVKPATKTVGGLPFIKNGCFSNKFQYNLCCPPDNKIDTLTKSIIGINNDAMCFGADGESEIIIRERIPVNPETPTIYNGMPLRPELRVFYDFTGKRVLYIENYWNWEYCHEAIERHPEDGKVFYDYYGTIYDNYSNSVRILFEQATQKLANVTELSGIWSVDFLLDENNKFWLIDMAIGTRSAYYDEYRCLMAYVYPKMEEFFFEVAFEMNNQEDRFRKFRLWTLSLNRTFGTNIIEPFMECFKLVDTLGPKRYPDSVVDGKYDTFLAFLLKYHPK